MRTIYDSATAVVSVPLAVYAADATTTGATVDLGQRALGFRSALVVALSGGVDDGSYTVALEHSDDGSSWVSIPADKVQGAFTAITTENAVQAVGYTAAKRYLRAKLTAASTTDGGTLGVVVIPDGATRVVDHG